MTKIKETRELNQNELESISGGMDPLHLLAQVNHLQSQNTNDALAGALTGVLGGAGTKQGSPRKIG